MFHILSGTPAPSVSESLYVEKTPYHEGGGDGGNGNSAARLMIGGSPTNNSSSGAINSNDQEQHRHRSNNNANSTNNNGNHHGNSNSHSNKKRGRRRRKGKSRSKVEPLSPYGNTNSSNNTKKSHPAQSQNSPCSKKHHDAPMTKRDIYFALDCEMVGVGQDGLTSAVGRVTIVNWENQIVLDTYVRVPQPITDYRTHVSGITPEHLQPRPGHSLMTFAQVREKVQSILRGKILIGHGLENDLKALGLYHPWTDIRDTATYSYYMRQFRDPVTQCVSFVPKKLRDLAWEKLGRQIQIPGVPHSPMEDAIAALDLYKEARGQWEDHLIRVAQQKDEEQQRQLMERRQEEQQRQQQQQQMRRFQWLGAHHQAAAAAVSPSIYQQAPPVMLHAAAAAAGPPVPPSPSSYRYPAPMMMMPPPHSPAAASSFLPPATPPPPPPPPPPMRSSGWFGFSRRPKHSSSRQSAAATIPSAMSHDSIATTSTVQSSFSQDFCSPRGAWHVSEDPAADGQEASQEAILEEPTALTSATTAAVTDVAMVVDAPPQDLKKSKNKKNAEKKNSVVVDCSESQESVTEESTSSATEDPPSPVAQPTDYEPPRYFTNPDPEPMSSSSWFKLPVFSRSSKTSSTKGDDSDSEPEEEAPQPQQQPKARRSSESETTSGSLFSVRLFPRRNSESCMQALQDKEEDEHSKSLH